MSLVKSSYARGISEMCRTSTEGFGQNALAMIAALRHLLGWLFSTLRSREDILLENLALRQQLLVLRNQRPRASGDRSHSRYLLHDGDGKFCPVFGEVIQAGMVKP